jgi:hypothetical protein
MNDLVKKWKVTGLLDDFSGTYASSKELREKRLKKTWQERVAENLEDFANDVLADENGDKDFNGMAIPLVRRIYDEGNGLKAEYEKMKEIYFEIIKKYGKVFDDFKEMGMPDAEAEMCALIGETYVERYGENEGDADEA